MSGLPTARQGWRRAEEIWFLLLPLEEGSTFSVAGCDPSTQSREPRVKNKGIQPLMPHTGTSRTLEVHSSGPGHYPGPSYLETGQNQRQEIEERF